jgi:hypothetical protein
MSAHEDLLERACSVLEGKSRSYVEDAKKLATGYINKSRELEGAHQRIVELLEEIRQLRRGDAGSLTEQALDTIRNAPTIPPEDGDAQ